MNIEGIEVPTESSFKMPAWLWIVCALAIAVGTIGLAVTFAMRPRDGWLWLIVDFVIFVGVANGILLWAAIFRVAQARWTGAVNRLGHSAIYFMPFLFGILIVLLVGVKQYAPWVSHPIPEKAAWLNVPFMIWREIFSLGLLWVLCALMVRWTLNTDAKVRNQGEVSSQEQFRLTAIGTAAVMWYTIAGSIVSYDFIMSLSPEWVSTMFAPYFWITNLYMGMAVLIVMAAILRKSLYAEQFLGPEQFHDMGNLLLGFSLFSMGLFFAQYLTIWYENLPYETFFLILRYFKGIWKWTSWAAFIIGYALPFLLLQSKYLKMNPSLNAMISVLVIAGVSLERYILIVPSLQPDRLMIYPAGILGLFAFGGAFVLAISLFLTRYSPVSSAQVALKASDMKLEILS